MLEGETGYKLVEFGKKNSLKQLNACDISKKFWTLIIQTYQG